MRRVLHTSVPTPFVGVAVTVLVVALGGIALASGSGGKIHACAQKKTGALRLAGKCRHGERSVTWSQAGPAGATGATGGPGPAGSPGPTLDVLPSGKTERGWFMADTDAKAGEFMATSITFNFELPSAPAVSYVDIAGPSTANCPGSSTNPQAAPGKLCLYLNVHNNVDIGGLYTFGIDAISSNELDNSADPFGAQLYGRAAEAGRATYNGTYAVTAP
jgi:hypothetical protein